MTPRLAAAGLVLGIASSVPNGVLAQCSPPDPRFSGTSTASVVNLIYSGTSGPLNQAVGMWSGTCGIDIPELVVRSSPVAGQINITVNLYSGAPGSECPATACGCAVPQFSGGVLTGGFISVGSQTQNGGPCLNWTSDVFFVVGE